MLGNEIIVETLDCFLTSSSQMQLSKFVVVEGALEIQRTTRMVWMSKFKVVSVGDIYFIAEGIEHFCQGFIWSHTKYRLLGTGQPNNYAN